MAFFGDASEIDAIVAPRAIDIEDRRRLVARLAEFADNWRELQASDKVAVLKFLVSGIVVTASSVEITLRVGAVVELARHAHGWDSDRAARVGKGAQLPSASEPHDGSTDETVPLTVPAFLKRVGMEMRHLIGSSDSHLIGKPDRSLKRLVAQAHRFREILIRSNGRPFAGMANECGVTTSYFTRIVRFAFLAPGILDAIVSGTQPIYLEAQKLSLMQTLPIEWQAQRRELGFG